MTRLADEWGWQPNAVAFALGLSGGNVADAKAYLTGLADEMDGPSLNAPSVPADNPDD